MNIEEIIKIANEYKHELPSTFPQTIPEGDKISSLIDHTLLKADALPEQVIRLCDEAKLYHFASVCINPIFVPLAFENLKDSPVPVCTVIGFPLGATPTQAKVAEAEWCIQSGAKELDMVIPIGMLKAEEYSAVFEDIAAVTKTSHKANCIVKVILEMTYLNHDEKIMGCLLSKEAGADFVKTSTGFGPSGATVEDVTLMRAIVGSVEQMGVKAAGGIRTYTDAIQMVKAGANRIGASAGVAINSQARELNER